MNSSTPPSATISRQPWGRRRRAVCLIISLSISTMPLGAHGAPNRLARPVAQRLLAAGRVALPTPISADLFSVTAPGQHASEVEPDAASDGDTLVAAFQVGRFYDGGSAAIGWATNRHGSWRHGLLPGITRNTTPVGPYDRASDPAVAHDAAHGVWLVSALAIAVSILVPPAIKKGRREDVKTVAIVVSRSYDGVTWRSASTPYTSTLAVAGRKSFYDKEWIACDNTATSRFYGQCYATWDDSSRRDRLLMSVSTDGGLSWSPPVSPVGNPGGLGGEPVIRPDGTVVVPAASGDERSIIAFSSSDGGATWGRTVIVSQARDHRVAGRMRTELLPSTAIDGAGRIYVAWPDCRFERACTANDLVMSMSSDGVAWSPVTRIPIDPLGSGADHFIPGLGIDPATSGPTAHLGLTYYYYPDAACTTPTCQLDVGYIASSDGGATWGAARRLAGPMAVTWLSGTSGGFMVGDYIVTTFLHGSATSIVANARAPRGAVLDVTIDAAPSQ